MEAVQRIVAYAKSQIQASKNVAKGGGGLVSKNKPEPEPEPNPASRDWANGPSVIDDERKSKIYAEAVDLVFDNPAVIKVLDSLFDDVSNVLVSALFGLMAHDLNHFEPNERVTVGDSKGIVKMDNRPSKNDVDIIWDVATENGAYSETVPADEVTRQLVKTELVEQYLTVGNILLGSIDDDDNTILGAAIFDILDVDSSREVTREELLAFAQRPFSVCTRICKAIGIRQVVR